MPHFILSSQHDSFSGAGGETEGHSEQWPLVTAPSLLTAAVMSLVVLLTEMSSLRGSCSQLWPHFAFPCEPLTCFLSQFFLLSPFYIIVLLIYNSHTIYFTPLKCTNWRLLVCSQTLYKQHHNHFWTIFITPKRNMYSLVTPHFILNGIVQYVIFCDWLLLTEGIVFEFQPWWNTSHFFTQPFYFCSGELYLYVF